MNHNRLQPRQAADQQALRKALDGAIAHIQAGRLDEAVKALHASKLALKHPVGFNILGDIHLKQGNPREALKAFDSAVKLAPTFPEAHCNRGAALQELGRLEEALSAEERALRHRPDYATAHFNRGNILKELGRPDEALAAYDRALKQKPVWAEVHLNRGLTLIDKNRLVEALAAFRQAAALQPNMVPAHLGRANAHHRLRQNAQALGAIETALAIEPGNVEALVLKTGFLLRMERAGEALAVAEQAIASGPTNPAAHAARSAALCKVNRFDEALAEADETIRLAPEDPEGYVVRALALSELARVEEQWEMLKVAERLGAAGHAFHEVRAIALAELGDLTEAAASFERAIELEPDSARSHYFYSMLLLYLGRFERGWAEHEWRVKDTSFKQVALARMAPPWRGEALDGKKVLVFSEQGLGDLIQFARFVPDVAARGGRVTLRVMPALAGMVARAFPAIDVTAKLGLRRDFDYQVSVMSLPNVLGSGADTRAERVPYLFADRARVEKWRERLGAQPGAGGFRVGIAWQGNPTYYRDRYRSIPLKRFAPLAAVPGVRLISLQAINGLDQLDDLPAGMTVERFGAEIEDNRDGIEEVAGLMANLDLLIMSDTGLAHLAGALGRPIWTALRYRPDWRWLDGRADSPWYPTMRLFRQTRHDDWDGVFAEIAGALGEAVADKV
jgi:tetratricopeptide (TPR) repeat protein